MTLDEAREFARFVADEGKNLDNSVIQCIIVLADYIERKGDYGDKRKIIDKKQVYPYRQENDHAQVFDDTFHE